MKCIPAIVLVIAALASAPVGAQESEAVAQAKDAAASWLALVDAGNYSASWEQAAGAFRSAVTRQA